jgi:hypothetical protein
MTATSQSDRSPAPGIIPEPPHLNDHPPWPPAASRKPAQHKPGRRNPVRIAFDKVMSALHGDKYMVGAYPAPDPEDAGSSDDAESPAR